MNTFQQPGPPQGWPQNDDVNSFKQPVQQPQQGWPPQQPQQPPPPNQHPGILNGNPQQNLAHQMNSMNLGDTNGPSSMPPFSGNAGVQPKFLPPPQQLGLSSNTMTSTSNQSLPPNQGGINNNFNTNNNVPRQPPLIQQGHTNGVPSGPPQMPRNNPTPQSNVPPQISQQQNAMPNHQTNIVSSQSSNLLQQSRPPIQNQQGLPTQLHQGNSMPPNPSSQLPPGSQQSFNEQYPQAPVQQIGNKQMNSQMFLPPSQSNPSGPPPSQQGTRFPGLMTPHSGMSQHAGMPPPVQTRPSPGLPPQTGMPPQHAMPPQQLGMPPQQPVMPPQQHGMPSQQPGMPPQQHGMPSQQPGMGPQPGMPPQQHGMPPQPGMLSQHGIPQPGIAPQRSMPPQQHGMIPPQPGMPPQPVMPPQPGMPPQQHGMPPQPGMLSQPGMPPQPGFQSSYPGGMQPQYPGMPPQQRNYNQAGLYNAPGYPGAAPLHQTPQQQQRKLDPDQMPNPIQVMAENQRSVAGPFVTNQAGLVPPLVTTKSITQDQGNSGPRFIRSSMYNVPATAEMMKQTAVPFALIISPFAKTLDGEIVPPIVNFGEVGPIRCIRCKGYMSPNMQFIDAGRRFQCLLCKATTEVPQEYFQHLDHTGQRTDKYERPELVLGTYEFVATKDYCRNNKPPNPPALIFVIDVSYNNIKSGLVHLLCSQMKEIIKNLPIDQGMDRSVMKVGFITYNNTVHFYNCKSNLAQPQMMVVGDVHEMFMPLLDGFLCDSEESSDVIDSLMEQIPAMFGDTRETETILLPAIQAGLEALKASECAGKLIVLHSSLPIADAPGKLKNRDDRNILGTEKEKSVLTPQTNAYNNLGQECVQAGCAVDLFIFNNSYIDLATIGQISRLTGGEIYKYTYFQADIDGHRVVNDLIKNISRPIAFDSVMRVRTSTGVRPTDFYGHFFMSNTTDMEIGAIDCDKSIAIEVKHDDKLAPEENVYIQVALLYTSCSGQRRLRILNLALKTCTQMADLFRCCDLDVIVLFFAKQIMFKLMETPPKAVKDSLEARCAQILACYRKNCASPTSAGQLILPECMKLLPLYASCLMKNDAISGGSDMTCDDRSYVMQFVLVMDLPMSVSYFYPRLIPIHDVDVNETDIPSPIRTTAEKMCDDGAYILENGIHMFIWLGLSLAPEFTQSVFGAPSSQQIDTDRCGVPIFENPLSHRVHGIIDSIQAERPRCMRITLVRQRDKLESVLRHFLIEDRGTHGAPSYVDYLCYLHKEIRSLLS